MRWSVFVSFPLLGLHCRKSNAKLNKAATVYMFRSIDWRFHGRYIASVLGKYPVWFSGKNQVLFFYQWCKKMCFYMKKIWTFLRLLTIFQALSDLGLDNDVLSNLNFLRYLFVVWLPDTKCSYSEEFLNKPIFFKMGTFFYKENINVGEFNLLIKSVFIHFQKWNMLNSCNNFLKTLRSFSSKTCVI